MKEQIKYKEGYKYQLHETYVIVIPITGFTITMHDFIQLAPDGTLMIFEGYAWDGPSGPTIDTKNFMRGSLVHDVLYQLMREGYLPQYFRPVADKLLYAICREDGMSWIRGQWVLLGVEIGGASSAAVQKEEILTAP